MTEPTAPKATGNSNLSFLMVAAAVGLMGLFVFLIARQNSRLKAEVGALRTALLNASALLKPGDRVSPLVLTGADGSVSNVEFRDASSPTLLLLLGQSCPHCDQAVPCYEQLIKDTQDPGRPAARLNVLGVVADAPPSGEFKQFSGIPCYRAPDGGKSWLARVNATPGAVLSHRAGSVAKLRLGEITAGDADDMRLSILESLGTRSRF